MTKQLVFLIPIFFVGTVAWADFNFMVQGRLSDNSGNPIGTPTAVEWQLFRDGDPATTGGTPVYTETGLITPINPQGVFSYELGSGTPVGAPLDASAYTGSNPLYALLSIAGTPLLPKLRVTPVPRSHVATLAESVQAGGVDTAALQDEAVTGIKIATSSISGTHVSNTAQLNVDRIGLGGAPATSLDLSAKTDAVRLPTGTSAERPSTPANGDTRYNSTLNAVESYVNGSWQTLSTDAGTVTGVAATLPLASSGGTSPTVSLPQSNGTTDGYLASSDWATFNSKVGSALPAGEVFVGNGSNVAAGVPLSGDATISTTGALTLVSTGTAGTYTKVTTDEKGRVTAGDTLAAGDIPSLDATKITSGVLDAARIPAGTDSGKLPLSGGTMSGSIDMGGNDVTNAGSIAASTVTVGGNSVVATNSSLTSGSVLFADGAASAGQDNSNFFWDNTNKRLGIGTTTPGAKLDIYDVSSAFPASSGASQSSGQRLRLGQDDGAVLDIGSAGGSGLWLQTGNGLNLATTYPMLINPNGGYVGIGTVSPNDSLSILPANGGGLTVRESDDGNDSFRINSYTAGSTLEMLLNGSVTLNLTSSGASFFNGGKVGIGTTSPTSVLHLKAGTATANNAPLKFTPGTNLTTPEPGAVEFDGTNLYFSTNTTNRQTFAFQGSAGTLSGLTSGSVLFANGPASAGQDNSNLFWDNSLKRLGIKTTAPESVLHVNGGITAESGVPLRLKITGEVSANASEIRTGGGIFKIYSGRQAAAHQSFDFSTGDNTVSGWTRLYIEGSSGKVGIGTTSPMSTLDVNGFAKLKLNGAAPATCDASHQGSLAMTSNATLCACDTSNNWVIVNVGGACVW